jgi:peroxiredoxin
LRDAVERSDAEVEVAAVGTGDLDYAEHFATEHRIAFPVLVDEDLATFRLVGAGTARVRDVAKVSVVTASFRAMRSGARQGKPGPAPMQLGATHVILPDGSVPYAWVNDDVADNAPIAEVLAHLR